MLQDHKCVIDNHSPSLHILRPQILLEQDLFHGKFNAFALPRASTATLTML